MTSALLGAILNTSLRDQIVILQSRDVNETAFIITEVFKRYQKNPDMYTRPCVMASKGAHTDALVKCTKKHNVDESTAFVMQLACIPNINSKKANLIIEHLSVTSMAGLIRLLDPHDETARIKKMTQIPGIGKVLATQIISYLFKDT